MGNSSIVTQIPCFYYIRELIHPPLKTLTNMKIKSLLTFTAIVFAACLWFSNSNGPGEIQGVDRTGSPLSPGYCNDCHSGGNFATNVRMALIDPDGDTISEYVPGAAYTLRVQVLGEGASGYGFQAVALNSDNSGAGSYGAAPDGMQVTTVNGVEYPEHSSRAEDGLFEIEWTAPEEGSGPISFYVAGNAVNGNFDISGDQADTTMVVVEEAVVSSAKDQLVEAFKLQIGPNPVQDYLQVQWDSKVVQPEQLRIVNSIGQVLKAYDLQSFDRLDQMEVPTSDFTFKPKGF